VGLGATVSSGMKAFAEMLAQYNIDLYIRQQDVLYLAFICPLGCLSVNSDKLLTNFDEILECSGALNSSIPYHTVCD